MWQRRQLQNLLPFSGCFELSVLDLVYYNYTWSSGDGGEFHSLWRNKDEVVCWIVNFLEIASFTLLRNVSYLNMTHVSYLWHHKFCLWRASCSHVCESCECFLQAPSWAWRPPTLQESSLNWSLQGFEEGCICDPYIFHEITSAQIVTNEEDSIIFIMQSICCQVVSGILLFKLDFITEIFVTIVSKFWQPTAWAGGHRCNHQSKVSKTTSYQWQHVEETTQGWPKTLIHRHQCNKPRQHGSKLH